MALQSNGGGGVLLSKSVFSSLSPSLSPSSWKMTMMMKKMDRDHEKHKLRSSGNGNWWRKACDVGEGSRKLQLVYASGGSNNGSNSSSSGDSGSNKKKGVPNSNYVVPLDKPFSSSNSSCITRPLAEILRDLNKRIPDNIIKPPSESSPATFISWYHANRMLSFYAPGWCGEIRDVIFSDNGSVTVVYRVTIRGSDGEAYRESTGTVLSSDGLIVDPVAAAEEIAFCRACARFGLGLYLYHEEQE